SKDLESSGPGESISQSAVKPSLHQDFAVDGLVSNGGKAATRDHPIARRIVQDHRSVQLKFRTKPQTVQLIRPHHPTEAARHTRECLLPFGHPPSSFYNDQLRFRELLQESKQISLANLGLNSVFLDKF